MIGSDNGGDGDNNGDDVRDINCDSGNGDNSARIM